MNVIFVCIFPSVRAPIGITYKKKIILRLKITPAPLAPTHPSSWLALTVAEAIGGCLVE